MTDPTIRPKVCENRIGSQITNNQQQIRVLHYAESSQMGLIMLKVLILQPQTAAILPFLAGIPSTDGRSGITIAIEFMMYFDQPPNDKCTYDIKSLRCQNAALRQIPDRIPPGLARILITDNMKLDYVQDFAFAHQQNLYR